MGLNFEKELQNLLKEYKRSGNIGNFRHSKLALIHSYYKEFGFPKIQTELSLSVIPGIFQEANYDGISWTKRNENLRHLKLILQLDCMFHNFGKTREKLTDQEFAKYIEFSFRAIKEHRN